MQIHGSGWLCGPLEIFQPTENEFSYFSHVHHSYSRIDYFFIDKTPLPAVNKTEYMAIVEFDHAPVILDLSFSQNPANFSAWRLNTARLAENQILRPNS